jgi:shikimate kinase/3-dehydroquinate synthase
MESTKPKITMEKINHTMEEVDSNILLVGMMGAGKTTVGKSLASYLNKTFIDSDHEIQKRTGVKISVIFEIEGEAGFRKREAEMLRELLKINNIVLATGGGVILNKENRELLKQNGTIVYLRATVDDLWNRTRQYFKPWIYKQNWQSFMINVILSTVKQRMSLLKVGNKVSFKW